MEAIDPVVELAVVTQRYELSDGTAYAYDLQVGERRDLAGNLCPYGKVEAVDGMQLEINDTVAIGHEQKAKAGKAMPIILGRAGYSVGSKQSEAVLGEWRRFGLDTARARYTGGTNVPALTGSASEAMTGDDMLSPRVLSAAVFGFNRRTGSIFEFVRRSLAGLEAFRVDLAEGQPVMLALDATAAYITVRSEDTASLPHRLISADQDAGSTNWQYTWDDSVGRPASDAFEFGESAFVAVITLEAP